MVLTTSVHFIFFLVTFKKKNLSQVLQTSLRWGTQFMSPSIQQFLHLFTDFGHSAAAEISGP